MRLTALTDAPNPYSRAAAIIGASAEALAAHPALNTTFDQGELVLHDRCDIGYAVQGRHGLVVPVIATRPRARPTSSPQRSRGWSTPAAPGRWRQRTCAAESFTITDARRLGGVLATPLLNTPQVAILGVHRVAERPVVRDGEVVARPVGMLSVGFDHRVLDGAAAAAFLLDVVERLERWGLG